MGGVIPAIESGYMKSALVRSMSRADEPDQQRRADRRRPQPVDRRPPVAADRRATTAASSGRRRAPPPRSLATLERTRAEPRPQRAAAALDAAQGGRQRRQQPDGAVDRVRAGPGHHRRVGRRAARGVRRVPARDRRRGPAARPGRATGSRRCAPGSTALAAAIGHRPRIVVGKPGLDGHSNGAEVIAVVRPPRRLRRHLLRHPPVAPTRSCSRRSRRAST